MIFGNEEEKIVKIATEYQSEMTDGVVQYDYKTGELFGAGFTTGTVENPANPFIEVFRLPQGERCQIDCKCYENGDCPFWVESEDDYCGGHFDEDMTDEFGSDRITCCIEAFAEEIGEDIRESIEEQVRDVLSEYLDDTLSKLNEIRIGISDRVAPYDYIKVRQEDWEMRVLDSYVDNAIENGLNLDGEPADYLDAEVQHLASVRFSEGDDVEFWGEVGCFIEDHDFDGALKLLQ